MTHHTMSEHSYHGATSRSLMWNNDGLWFASVCKQQVVLLVAACYFELHLPLVKQDVQLQLLAVLLMSICCIYTQLTTTSCLIHQSDSRHKETKCVYTKHFREGTLHAGNKKCSVGKPNSINSRLMTWKTCCPIYIFTVIWRQTYGKGPLR